MNNKKYVSRKEEEKAVREYITENSDIESYETEELVKNLDMQTIEAFEEAMDNVAKEYEREKSKAELLRNYIQDKNRREETVTISLLKTEQPYDISPEEIDELLENIDDYPELDFIDFIKREEEIYVYDTTLWTRQYAQTAVILDEKDILEAIAQRTRIDCKIYPRPVQMEALKNIPYKYTEEEIFAALEKMKEEEKYADIGTVTASNGGVCIYSSDHMSEKYAKSLCEYLEVEWKKNQ